MAAAVVLPTARTLGRCGIFSRTSRLLIRGVFDRAVRRRTRTCTSSGTRPTENRPKKETKKTRHFFLQFFPSPKSLLLELPLSGLDLLQYCVEAFSELLQRIRINRKQKGPRNTYTTCALPTVVIDSTEKYIKPLCYF